MERKKKILYIVAGGTGFINTDEKILLSIGIVRKINYKSLWNYFSPKVLFNLIWCETVVIWFASIHALPVILLNYLFYKRLLIIAGGFDVANEPNIKYGAMQGKSRAIFGKWLLSRAHAVIAVSKSNKREIIDNANVSINKIKLIYNSIPKPIIVQNISKKNEVLTVGEINKETFLRKGLDRFIKVAEYMPDVQFIHIGKWTDNRGKPCHKMINYVKKISPSNINYIGYVDKKSLEKYYSESKVYLQLSRHEAFGVSVVESMSYGCIPIVSHAFSLPEIVDTQGFVVSNIDEALQKIKFSLAMQRESIDPSYFKRFSIEARTLGFKRLLLN